MENENKDSIGLGEKLLDSHLSVGKKKVGRRIMYFVLMLIVACGGYFLFFTGSKSSNYEFVKVSKKDVREEVEITGNVEAGATIALSFRDSGLVDKINFESGAVMKKNEIVASLKNKDQELRLKQAQTVLSGAQANLAQKLAGATDEDLRIAAALVNKADFAAEKNNIDLLNARQELELVKQKYLEDEKKAQLMVDDAKSKLDYAEKNKTNTGKSQDQSVETMKQDLEAQLYVTASQIQQSLINLKSIIIDDGNSVLENDYDRLDTMTLNNSKELYYQVKNDFDPLYVELKSGAGYETEKLKDFSVKEQVLVGKLLQVEKIVTDMLSTTPASSTISSDFLTGLKNKLLADAAALSSSLSGLNLKYQGILTAVLNVSTNGDSSDSNLVSADNFYQQQLQNLAQVKIDHQVDLNARESNIRSLQAQYKIQLAESDSARASFDLKKNPPRAVDVAFLRTEVASDQVAVSLAEEALEKTLLRTPFDGKLSRKNIEVGEYATAASVLGPNGKTMLEMISANKLKINANIAEVDIGKIKVGDKAQITLDALGDKSNLSGTITKIDPVETKIQDVVFYKAEIVIDSDDVRIKPGMTATVNIVLKEALGALTLPEKAIQTDGERRFIRVFSNEQVKNIDVTTGIRNLQGDIEIKSGAVDGQEIILRTISGK